MSKSTSEEKTTGWAVSYAVELLRAHDRARVFRGEGEPCPRTRTTITSELVLQDWRS